MHLTIWWIVSGLLVLGVYSVFEFLYRYRVTSRGKKKIPTQLPFPLIGNALHFLKDRSSSGVLKALGSYLPSYPISAVWLGPKLMVMITDPNLAKSLMVKGVASKKAEDLYSVFDHIATGVFGTRDVKKWVSLRKPLDKMLEPKWVDTWIEIFNRNGDLLCKAIGDTTGELMLPLRTFEYSLSNLCESHLGLQNWQIFYHLGPTLLKDVGELMGMMMKRLWEITIRPDVLFKRSRCYSEFMQAKRRSMVTYNQFLDARKAHLKENNLDMDAEGCYTDFIMLRAKQLNCDEEDTFKLGIDLIGAGAHTTTYAVATTILFLAIYPEYQKKLYEEILTVFGESSEAPTEAQLNSMEYLDMVIKETLRHAGVAGIGRDLEKDVEIDGYIIPRNSLLLFNHMVLNYNPKYWERPKEFYPDHFTPEAEAARPKGTFLPFSLGARNCPGKLYATISMKVALSKLLQQFEFSTHLRLEELKFYFNLVRIPFIYDVVAKRRTPLNK